MTTELMKVTPNVSLNEQRGMPLIRIHIKNMEMALY
jgi:hypothetical protein